MSLDIDKEIDYLIETTHRKRKRHLLNMTKGQQIAEVIKSLICQACHQFNLTLAKDIYSYVNNHQVPLTQAMYLPLLNLVAGFGDIGSGSTTPRPDTVTYDLSLASQIFSDMKAQGVPLDESSYTAVIRCHCLSMETETAFKYYQEMIEQQILPKNRTISPLLSAYARNKDKDLCIRLFFNDLNAYSLLPVEKDFISMLELIVSTRDEILFQQVFSLFEDYIFTPSQSSIEALRQVFNTVFMSYTWESVTPFDDGRIVLQYGQRMLASIEISNEQRETMLSEIAKYAWEMRQIRSTSDFSLDWSKFLKFIKEFHEKASNPSEMIVIDGANVGFFESTYPGAPVHIDYDKVEWMRCEVLLPIGLDVVMSS